MKNKTKSLITDINYYTSSIKNSSDLKKLYAQGILHTTEKELFPQSIDGIMDGVDSRLKTRMSKLSLEIFHALGNSVSKDLAPTEEIYLFTSFAEIETTKLIIEDIVINKSRLVSPTLFHNSVHNTPLGYYTIINKIHNFCTTISDGLATDFSFSQWMNYKNLLQDEFIVAAGDEFSSFYELDQNYDLKLPPCATAFRVIPNQEKGFSLLESCKTLEDLDEEMAKIDFLILPGNLHKKLINKNISIPILTDYTITGDQPIGAAFRLSLPFALNLEGRGLVVTATKNEQIVTFEVV